MILLVCMSVGSNFLVINPSTAQQFNGVCRDPWVTGAVSKVMNRPPIGRGDRGECNIRLYGNGKWNSYEELEGYVRKSANSYSNGVCRDPWITGAVSKVMNRPPRGRGELGECDMYRYGSGSWSSYTDLLNKVRSAFGK